MNQRKPELTLLSVIVFIIHAVVFDQNSAQADIGQNILAEISAETISARFSCFGHLAETAISAEITLFRPKLTCFGHNILNSREYYGNFVSLFRYFRPNLPKNSLSAKCYYRLFCFGRISLLAERGKILFRSNTKEKTGAMHFSNR